MVKLRATQGADEANVGGQRYRVDNDGTIDVPIEAEAPLLEKGGFVLAEELPPVSAGNVRVSHPEGIGCSFDGVNYEPDEHGTIIVPAESVGALTSHGFTPVGQTVEQAQRRARTELPDAAPDGEVILQGEPGAGVSWNGNSYTADEDGLVIVPLGAAETLSSHGFIVAPVKAPAEAEPVADEWQPQAEPQPGSEQSSEPEPVVEPEVVAEPQTDA